ncbi:MAG: hypothetical protein BGP13_09210 [Sphingobacteriales bacterium 40-81]|nr:MAG: hypothetical protein BGP13_09210 [Sphingobacteriales bacterium 40-81]
MPVAAYKFPAYRLHFSLVISQRYTKDTQRAAKNNKTLCVTLCMLCGTLCSKSCFTDANRNLWQEIYQGLFKNNFGHVQYAEWNTDKTDMADIGQ